MWSGIDPDTELFASGVVVDDDGEWSGGQALVAEQPGEESARCGQWVVSAWSPAESNARLVLNSGCVRLVVKSLSPSAQLALVFLLLQMWTWQRRALVPAGPGQGPRALARLVPAGRPLQPEAAARQLPRAAALPRTRAACACT